MSPPIPRRWLLFAFLFIAATASPSAARSNETWITLGSDLFVTATDVFAAPPELAALPRLAEAEGVILTRIPRSGLERLSSRIHELHRRCGGFAQHATLEDGLATLERLRIPHALRGPQELPFAIDRPDLVTPLLDQVSEAELESTIDSLSTGFANRFHAHPSGTAAAHWIRDLWLSYAAGRKDVTVELWNHGGLTLQPSVVMTIAGTTLPDEIVVIGAHEDSIRSGCSINVDCDAPGADDDASGVASISEAIRVALGAGFAPQRTVKFVAYAAEEVGLVGSRDIASDFATAEANVVAVLQQDMTGYTESSTVDIALIDDALWTDAGLNQFLRDLVASYLPELTTGDSPCDYACSDHAAWAEQGYAAAFAFEAPFDLYNPYLHTGNDDLHRLDLAHVAKFARLTVAFLVETAIDGGLFADGFDDGTTDAWALSPP